MANKTINMSKLRQMLRLYSQGESKLKISELTGISRNTLKKYIKRFIQFGINIKDIERISDEELDCLFDENFINEPTERYKNLSQLFPQIEKDLRKRGITRLILWQQYIQQYPDGYKLSQFKEHYRRWSQYGRPVMHIEHKAGDKMYIDFAGEKLPIVDEYTGEIRYAEVFVAILGASQLTYVEATDSQRKEDLISCCENALHFYGGVPMAIVPDNLKSAVIKSDKYEPTLNQAFENFASHYNTAVLPTRAYKPKDKALVEGAVKISYRRIYAGLYGKIFHSLEALNEAIQEALEVHNNMLLTNRHYSRRQLFEEIEKVSLQALPLMRYDFKRQQMATVSSNGHVCLKEDTHYYSVPYLNIGKKVKILYSQTHLEIYFNYSLIANHKRGNRQYGYTTESSHMASNHQYITEWNPERFRKWAGSIDPLVEQFIVKVMESKKHPEQAFKSCQGILNAERKAGRERLIRACQMALEYENYTYHIIKSLLDKKYDIVLEPEELLFTPEHENIRGESYYQ